MASAWLTRAPATGVVLRLASLLASVLKRTGMSVATRLTGLIIAATAVEFIVDGVAVLFPGLLK